MHLHKQNAPDRPPPANPEYTFWQMEYTVLPHDHVGIVAPDYVLGPFEVDDELLNPCVTAETDFVYVVSGVYDRVRDVRLQYACGGAYGEMSVRGAGFVGNHCRDGRQDFGETGIDQGGPCP